MDLESSELELWLLQIGQESHKIYDLKCWLEMFRNIDLKCLSAFKNVDLVFSRE